MAITTAASATASVVTAFASSGAAASVWVAVGLAIVLLELVLLMLLLMLLLDEEEVGMEVDEVLLESAPLVELALVLALSVERGEMLIPWSKPDKARREGGKEVLGPLAVICGMYAYMLLGRLGTKRCHTFSAPRPSRCPTEHASLASMHPHPISSHIHLRCALQAR